MTFIEALAKYHEGKKIKRSNWEGCWEKIKAKVAFENKGTQISCPMTIEDILADDWVVEE